MSFRSTHPCRRRIKTPFVVKYLEGVPSPNTLINHLAGGDLRSAAATPFFTTVPRYIKNNTSTVNKGLKLSKLFFHHVLYPAGGARTPYQAVVVRDGRSVSPCRPVRTDNGGGTRGTDRLTSKDPLAAPDAMQGHHADSSNEALLCSSSNVWSRHDPARRPYFYAPHTSRDAESSGHGYRMGCPSLLAPPTTAPFGERGSSTHHRRPEAALSERAHRDGPLLPLCAAIQASFLQQHKQPTESESKTVRYQEITQCAVNDSLGLLYRLGDNSNVAGEGTEGRDELIKKLLHSACQGRRRWGARANPTGHIYMQAALPDTVVVQLSVKNTTTGHAERWCRLAGGVEPSVPFAVGTPLQSRDTESRPFSHITCLLRVSGSAASANGADDGTNDESGPEVIKDDNNNNKNNNNRSARKAPLEPWRMGLPLDPLVPYCSRTATERSPSAAHSGGGQVVLGRLDAEMYVLPQVELMVSLHVPRKTSEMCVEHNNDRLAQQTRLGHGSQHSGGGGAWGSSQRLTAARLLHGQHQNAVAAMSASMEKKKTTRSDDDNTAASVGDEPAEYEVRGLPGDVIYIPRGWGFTVRRVVGTAVVERGGDNKPIDSSAVHTLTSNRSLAHDSSSSSTTRATPHPSHHNAAAATSNHDIDVSIDGVEVDALIINYKPYPVLSKEQARVYVAANYVSGGIEEFYEKGGNNVFHAYE